MEKARGRNPWAWAYPPRPNVSSPPEAAAVDEVTASLAKEIGPPGRQRRVEDRMPLGMPVHALVGVSDMPC